VSNCFKIYHDKNKLQSAEMMMSTLHTELDLYSTKAH
jgi:hypothetical protein